MRGEEAGRGGSHFVARPSLLGEAGVRAPQLQRTTAKLGRDLRPGPAWPPWARAVPPAACTPRAPPTYPPANRCTNVSLWLILSSACPPGAEAGRGAGSPPLAEAWAERDAGGAGGAAAAEGPPANPPGAVQDSATSTRLRSPSPEESDVPT